MNGTAAAPDRPGTHRLALEEAAPPISEAGRRGPESLDPVGGLRSGLLTAVIWVRLVSNGCCAVWDRAVRCCVIGTIGHERRGESMAVKAKPKVPGVKKTAPKKA